MPRTDWPAAHSMDTTWYAVDANGHIARFMSGEGGAVPHEAASEGGAGEPNFDYDALWAELRRVTGDAESDPWDGPPGVYAFGNDDYGAPGAYARESVPGRPVHIEELAPAVRGALTSVVLETKFADADHVQLADHFDDDECASWDDLPLRGDADA